jgi:hypothetical protein
MKYLSSNFVRILRVAAISMVAASSANAARLPIGTLPPPVVTTPKPVASHI